MHRMPDKDGKTKTGMCMLWKRNRNHSTMRCVYREVSVKIGKIEMSEEFAKAGRGREYKITLRDGKIVIGKMIDLDITRVGKEITMSIELDVEGKKTILTGIKNVEMIK